MELISVIVPVYKVEKYLNRCVKSIVDQTYSNLEILLVDDGSPDDCPKICDEWAQKDERIRVIHKLNGGLSDARNVGMKFSTGDLIAFVDSDDWIASDMYQKLYDCLKSSLSDIASCGALRIWEDTKQSQTMMHFSGDHVLNKTEAMEALIQSTFLIQTVWNKLYKATLAKQIPFEKGKVHEDEYWSWQVISKASKVGVIEEPLYFYVQRYGSIMGNQNYSRNHMNAIEAKLQRNAFIRKCMPELLDIDYVDLLYSCYYHGCLLIKNENIFQRKSVMDDLKKIVRTCKISDSYMKKFSVLKRFRIFMIKSNFQFVCKLDCMLNKA